MNIKELYLTILIVIVSCVSLSVPASGKSFSFNVGDFDELKVEDDLSVVCHCNSDSVGLVKFECDQRTADRIMLRNSKGKLKIELVYDERKYGMLPVITVYTNQIKKVENDGIGALHIHGNVSCAKAEFALTGNGRLTVDNVQCDVLILRISTGCGTITAKGNCGVEKIRNLGTGFIEATNVTTSDVQARIFGTGTVKCKVSDGGKINLKGSGSGRLYYIGEPAKVTVKKLGSLKALPLQGH